MEKFSTEALKELLNDLHSRLQELNEDDETGSLQKEAIKKKIELVGSEMEKRQQTKNKGFV